jgi:hemin uptake protein HemP
MPDHQGHEARNRSAAAASTAELRSPPRRIRSVDLFAGSPRLVIEHRGTEYRLQETRMGKLILTK